MAQPHRTVTRVMRIMESVVAAGAEGVSLTRLAADLDSAKSSIHGFVRGLVAEGYVVEAGGRYRMGPALGALLVGQAASLGQYALPVMRELRDDLNETVTLAIRVGDSIVYTDSVQSTNVICYSAPLRVRRPLWPTSAGKVFLSQEKDPESTLRALESEPLPEETVTARLRELEEVARTGMGFNRGETVGDVSAVAVGVWRADELVGSINVAGPRERLAHRLEEIGQAVRTRLLHYDRSIRLTHSQPTG